MVYALISHKPFDGSLLLLLTFTNTIQSNIQYIEIYNCICEQSVLLYYTVGPYDVKITGNNTITYGSQLQLHCSSDGGPQLEYSWNRMGILYTSTDNLSISNVTTLDGGNYTCTVTNDAGSSSNTITVYGESRSSYQQNKPAKS